ncbi:hypothetical protein ACGTZG_00280 [Megasphaera hexanoica]|uniref:Uncharacterized protein n=2 Tax=Megasphaera hexanoica TaxID=1675036 RepID=A0ABW7DL72_9FIRM
MDTNGPLKTDKETQDALKVIVARVEYFRDENNWPVMEYTDDFKQFHPRDSALWEQLFTLAALKNQNLADVLCFLRGSGCELIPDAKYGYAIRPIIGGHGFKSHREYEEMRKGLALYSSTLVDVLKKLGEMNHG